MGRKQKPIDEVSESALEKRTPHKQITKDRIQATKLIDKLQKFAVSNAELKLHEGKKGQIITTVSYVDENGNEVFMTKEQIRAAEILLNKVIPNQTKQEIEGNVGVTYVSVVERMKDPRKND